MVPVYAPQPQQVVPQNVPIQPVVQVNFDLHRHQSKVKCNSKCMNIWAWILIVAGAINVVVNIMALFMADSFTTFKWFDKNKKIHTGTISVGFILLMCVAKIVGHGFLIIKQGRSTHKVFQPILKEYRDAERGVTQGIPMSERKSELMLPLKREIWKITIAQIFILFVVCLSVRHEGISIANNVVHQSFQARADSKNEDSVKFSMSLLETIAGDDEEDIEKLFEDHTLLGEDEGDMNPYADEFEKSGLYGNETISAPPVTPDTIQGAAQKIRKDYGSKIYGARHAAKKHRWNRPEWDTKDMTEDQTKDFVKMVVSWITIAIFVYGTIATVIFQALYICVINKAKSHQERLERHFMGDPSVSQPSQVAAQASGNIGFRNQIN